MVSRLLLSHFINIIRPRGHGFRQESWRKLFVSTLHPATGESEELCGTSDTSFDPLQREAIVDSTGHSARAHGCCREMSPSAIFRQPRSVSLRARSRQVDMFITTPGRFEMPASHTLGSASHGHAFNCGNACAVLPNPSISGIEEECHGLLFFSTFLYKLVVDDVHGSTVVPRLRAEIWST